MANYSNLKSALDEVIKTNIHRLITGDVLNHELDDMIDSLGLGYQYMGLATTATDPGTPDARVVYLATTPGTYTHFGNISIGSGKIAFFRWDGSWHKDEVEVQPVITMDDTPTEGSDNPVKSGGIYDALATKQDTIADLSDIRSGAAAGATAYQKPGTGIPSSDMASAVQTSLGKADTAYQKPGGGIPSTDLASGVNTSLGKADTAYQKPVGGIPSSDMSAAVQTSLGKADTAIQDVSGKQDKITTVNVTVDNNTGTPSGTASVSGDTLSLAFSNLKGATGATGPAGPAGATGPQGPQGLQGNSGYSGAAGELEVVNNLTQGGATSALSAEMGKNLYQTIIGKDKDYQGVLKKSITHVTYTNNVIANDGTLGTGTGKVSGYLPVVPGETLVLSSGATTKIAYYDEGKVFISLVSMTSGINEYTVPSNAAFARLENVYNGGAVAYMPIRYMDTPVNKTFADLIFSPLKTVISVGFTGDSNTKGYGLASDDKPWADLIADAITGVTSCRYDMNSPWVEAFGFNNYSNFSNFKNNSQVSIWTDATSLTMGANNNLSSTWEWYVDGVYQTGKDSSASIPLDGALHKVTVKFTGGQIVGPNFTIAKTITTENTGVTGVSISNMTFKTTYDWIFIMIGTNHRTQFYNVNFQYGLYYGRGTYVVPFPNHKTDPSYQISQLQAYRQLMDLFGNQGYDIVNCAAENAAPFIDSTLYQSDNIHFNAKGHKVIANMVAGKLGLPIYVQAE